MTGVIILKFICEEFGEWSERCFEWAETQGKLDVLPFLLFLETPGKWDVSPFLWGCVLI